MEEALPRSRYSRSNSKYRKRKSSSQENTLIEKIIKQALFCICLLIVVGAIKNINSPLTNLMSDKIKTFLFQNIDLKSVYTNVDDFINNLIKVKAPKSADSSTNGNATIQNTDASTAENANSNITNINSKKATLQDTQDIVNAINLKYKFITPVQGSISSPYGERMNPLLKKLVFHNGVDIETQNGAEIKAALDGIVTETGNDSTYGNYIKIKCGDDLQTIYAHCSKILFKKGSSIKQGQVIGNVGDKSLTIGANLHFEVVINQKTYDPMNFIKANS
jgi:murein DD-endopeptidase MepM/ murein hydrolase activator NlpD